MSLDLNRLLYKNIPSIAAFLFFALTLAIPSGYSYGPAILLLSSLAAFMLSQRHVLLTNTVPVDKRLATLFLILFLIAAAATLYHGDGNNLLDQPSRYLLAIPIIFLLRTFPIPPSSIWAGLTTGAVLAAGLSFWQTHFAIDPASGILFDRATGFVTSAIPFGAIALSIGLMSLAGLPWANAQSKYRRLWQAIVYIGFVAGSYASLKSGARGSWIALGPVAILFILSLGRKLSLRAHVLLFLCVLAAILLTIQFNGTAQNRYRLAIKQFDSYITQHDVFQSSVGERLEAWRAALINIAERPLTGWSQKEYQAQLETQVSRQEIAPEVADLANVHNNYLEIWISQGISGLLALLWLFLFSFTRFFRHIREDHPEQRSFALAGAVLVTSFACYGLTHVILGRNSGVMFFTVSLIIFWTGLRERATSATDGF